MKRFNYRILKVYRAWLGYVYRGLKKIVRFHSYYQTYLGCMREALMMESLIKEKKVQPGRETVLKYKTKWRVLSTRIPGIYIRVYSAFSGIDSSDYVPDSLYFTHIEPLLNNKEYSRSFADKNMYSILFDKNIQPKTLLRKIHGTYLGPDYEMIKDVDVVLKNLSQNIDKIILKNAINSQGGKSISLLKSINGSLYSGDQEVTKKWLDSNYLDHFILQEVVKQHPFYSAFNASSLNTLRVFTYRSVKDELVHVLHTVLRVGAAGAAMDNISSGGKACGINSDGTLKTECLDYYGNISNRLGEVELKPGMKLFEYGEIKELAKKVAAQQLYSRVIGFDFCVDEEGKVVLIELNNFDIGVNGLQILFGPLFGPFTDEVLKYCVEQKKKGFRHHIV